MNNSLTSSYFYPAPPYLYQFKLFKAITGIDFLMCRRWAPAAKTPAMGKVDPRAVIGALKELIAKAKKSKDPAVKREALKTREVVWRLKEKIEREN